VECLPAVSLMATDTKRRDTGGTALVTGGKITMLAKEDHFTPTRVASLAVTITAIGLVFILGLNHTVAW